MVSSSVAASDPEGFIKTAGTTLPVQEARILRRVTEDTSKDSVTWEGDDSNQIDEIRRDHDFPIVPCATKAQLRF